MRALLARLRGTHRSVAGRVTHQISSLLLVAVLVLFFGGYLTVSNIFKHESIEYARTMLNVYYDLIVYDAEQKGVPIDLEHADIPKAFGDYLCTWHRVDYAYLYVPHPEDGTVTFLSLSANKDKPSSVQYESGETVPIEFTQEQLDVWNAIETVAYYERENEFGHELSAISQFFDNNGHFAIIGVDISYTGLTQRINEAFLQLAGMILVVLFCVDLAIYWLLRRRVSRPAQHLSRGMQEFLSDGTFRQVSLPTQFGDEYVQIASSFERMTGNIDRYVKDINALTQEQAGQQAELNIASRIQRSFLPDGSLDLPELELRAMNDPAKDVGGDFYDYLPLDEHRTMVAIGDVSGKGMTAAMHMSVTLMLIRQFAKLGLDPDEILRRVNDALSEKNASLLFATAFVGVYDDRDRTFTYSNAGHNHPYLVGRALRTLDGAQGTLLGLFEGESYECAVERLEMGDSLFLYTDGVTEATDPNRRFFGDERLAEFLRSCREAGRTDLIPAVTEALNEFCGEAEPHDDVTMLVLRARRETDDLLDADVREMPKIRARILDLPLPRPTLLNLCLAAEEWFVNICSYAYEGAIDDVKKARFVLTLSDRVVMRFEDGGIPYNPLEDVPDTNEDYDPDLQIGGLGKFLSFSLADDVRYEYRDGKNILTLICNRKEELE